jgi:hypothetical protein
MEVNLHVPQSCCCGSEMTCDQSDAVVPGTIAHDSKIPRDRLLMVNTPQVLHGERMAQYRAAQNAHDFELEKQRKVRTIALSSLFAIPPDPTPWGHRCTTKCTNDSFDGSFIVNKQKFEKISNSNLGNR